LKKFLFIIITVIIGCSYASVSFSVNENYYSQQLQASYLYNTGELDKALDILQSLKKEVKDPIFMGQ